VDYIARPDLKKRKEKKGRKKGGREEGKGTNPKQQ
jgi:hypothetical protein